MNNFIKKVNENSKRLLETGIVHVLGTSVINKVIGFVLSILIIRILSKADYGVYSYAYNIISIFLLFNGLGIKNGILQYGSEDLGKDKQNSYLKFGFKFGLIANIVIAVAIFLYVIFNDLSFPSAKNILMLMMLIPVFTFVLEYAEIFLRVKFRNKEYASVTSVHSLSQAVCVIIGSLFIGVYGYIAGFYASLFISIYYIYYISKEDLYQIIISEKKKLKDMMGMIKFSLVAMSSNAMSQLLYLLDVFLIGIIIKDVLVIASYKASITIPTALNFISIAILTAIYPYFVKNKSNTKWLITNISKVMGLLVIINLPIAGFMFFGSDYIVNIVYGNEYSDAVPIFKVLAVGYAISTILKIPSGNFLLMLGKVKLNLYIAIISGCLNIVLNIILIKQYGSIGAAYATLVVIVVSSLLSFGFLINYSIKTRRIIS